MNTRKKIILAAVGILVALVLVLMLIPSPVEVSGARVNTGPFAEYVEDEGRTRLRDTYTVSAPIGGYLRRVALEPGDTVEAGDAVFVLEPTPAPALDARSREQARENLSAARARLEATEASEENLGAEARQAERELRRLEQLHERGAISTTELERAENEADRTRSAARAAQAMVSAARFEVENARAVLEVAEGERSPDEEQTVRVSAPVSGVVLRRDRCCEGVIEAGAPVLEIGNLEDLEIRVDLLSTEAVRVRPDMKVEIIRWGGEETLEGKVRRVEPAGFQRVSALGVEEQRVPVRVEITSGIEDWSALGEGYRVEARFILWADDDVLQVPTSALFRDGDNWKVFVVDGRRARIQAVQTGRRSGLVTQVLEGLSEGDVVINHPGDHLEDGQRVRVEMRD